MAGTTECPFCTESYIDIGKHWAGQKCSYPELSDRQLRIIDGTLLGDGCIANTSGNHNARFTLSVCERSFIDWVSDELGCFVSNVSNRGSRKEEWRDQHLLRTVKCPVFNSIRDRWYPDGKKCFPDDIDLDQLVLSMWYVTDGGLSEDNRWNSRRAYISAWNERKNEDKILSYFDSTPFDPYWSGNKQIYIPADQTDEFLEWIEGPIPGYEYKWGESLK